jgi:hypothetical protein
MIPSNPPIKPVSYAAVRDLIRNGDVALCRGGSVEGSLISEVTGSQYTHATMLGWAKPDTLMIGETRQRADGRLIDCRSEIARWPGYYDVYRVRSRPFDGNAAWTFMCHAAGSRYGWAHIARIWARRRLGEHFASPIPNNDDPGRERFCSELVHAALRAGGGPQFQTFDCDVAPGDLARGEHVRYLFTLFASDAQAEEARQIAERIADCKM